MDNILTLKNVNKSYGSIIKNKVIFDLSLEVSKGSFTSIIGQSGSGKSTLLNIMGTLDKPDSGEVWVSNQRVDKMNKNQLAELRNEVIGFIFQFHYLLPEFSAIENVLMPYQIKNYRITKEARERAEYLLEIVGLYAVKNNLANNMSGGQQQRTAIARALMNNPQIILADEPTGNLDSESTEKVYETLRKINDQFNTTFVIITHDSRIAKRADRVIEIVDGRIKADTLDDNFAVV